MLTILVLLFLLIIFNLAAARWGFTSSDGLESKEWERRQNWPRITPPASPKSNVSRYPLRQKRKKDKPSQP